MDAYSAADDEHRCYIAYLCGELGAKESAGTLVMGMHDPNHVLRRVATIAAGNIGDKALISELEGLLEDEEMDVRVSAVESLGRLASYDEQAVLAVATRLSKADLAERRRSSATLFAALRDTDRLARLIKDEDSGVRKAAIFALAELRASSSVNHLVMALVDEEPDVRMSAAGALGALGGEQAVQSLLVALKDQNQWVKCAALRSLGALHVAEAEPSIVELIDQSEGLVLIAALRTLQEINSDRAIQLARQALEHSDKEVVKAALEILSLTDEAWLDEYRDRLLCHEHWDIRSLFIKAFAEHRGKLAIPSLQEALNRETDDLVKRQILDTLEGLS
jgi:HEAT repeat protein